jgi:hypothetical protein
MADVDPSDRKAYLEEQIARQKRGESIDVAWVTQELERVRREQVARLQASQRNMRWLVIATAIMLAILWVRRGGGLDRGGVISLGLIVIGLLTAYVLRARSSRPGAKRPIAATKKKQ